VAIDVADTGSGIDAQDRERIFERFYRSASARDVADGAGLGLAVARWIAREHDGEVTVRDADPRGAIFTISLPTRDPPPRN
jgi:two-component system sensor histidine kinase CiaH